MTSTQAASGSIGLSQGPVFSSVVIPQEEYEVWKDAKDLLIDLAKDKDISDKYRERAKTMVSKLVLGKL